MLQYDLRTRTALVCGALALALAASVLLGGRVRRANLFLVAFAADIGLWYLAQSFYGFFQAAIWQRAAEWRLLGSVVPNATPCDALLSATYDVSDDGKLAAYSLSEAGSDWETIHVREVDSARDRPDVIRWVKFSGPSWRFSVGCATPFASSTTALNQVACGSSRSRRAYFKSPLVRSA